MNTFAGFPREGRRAGVRNLLLILPTSPLVNKVAELVGEALPDARCVSHFTASPSGARTFHAHTLAGFAANPNVGHVVIIGDGSGADLAPEVADLARARGVPVDVYTLKHAGSVRALAEQVVARSSAILADLERAPRCPVPISELVVGTECGGSDAYSGLTANPALGRAVDLLIDAGGTALLCEIPEMIGAERLLAARAIAPDVAGALLAAVQGWERLVVDFGEDLRGAQPTPGNQEGGLTTIEEKSLGATAKGGTQPLVEVVGYGQSPSRSGLVVMDTPGHDVEQLTGMAAGGAQIVVFTTGRGTPTASPIMPTVKVSTNSVIARHLADHIDVDAGVILTGAATKEDLGRIIYSRVCAVAEGLPTAAEHWGQHDFALPRTAPSWRQELKGGTA